MSDFLPESIDGLPNLCGSEHLIAAATAGDAPVFLPDSDVDFARVRSAFAIALHMHQPLIPAGPPAGGAGGSPAGDLRSAAVVSNLRYMLDHPEEPDAHNAAAFLRCYRRMGEFIPQLLAEGKSPRVMLDYSGCLLHGLRQMGAGDVIDALKPLAQDPALRKCVEWLGTAWGHAVAPSTPPQDFRLHVRAWQRHFAAVFGLEALSRVRGFSPPEMALPNHPDVCHAFVQTLRECGYRWVLVQEHTVERAEDGGPVRTPHLPHRLLARNSSGQTADIIAIIKTQGSDTKLVGQMQPYYEARGLSRATSASGSGASVPRSVPQLVTQIADGENGGVMMNEFPPKFMQVTREASGSDVPALNVTEYLEHLSAAGVAEADLPAVRPLLHHRIWQRFEDGAGPKGPERLESALEQLRREGGGFHVEGGSWTGDRSWVRGYEGVLGPMHAASRSFAEMARRWDVPTTDPRYRNALFHLLLAQTSCFRYWGEGRWADYGRELCRRAGEAAGRPTSTRPAPSAAQSGFSDFSDV